MAAPINGDGLQEKAEEELVAVAARLRRIQWGLLNMVDEPGSADAIVMAAQFVDEALLRLRPVPLPGEPQNAQDDPLVFGVQSRVGT